MLQVVLSSISDIPHFKQMIIMASNCDFCGYKTNEVKSGAGISEYGTKITLHLTDSTDLSRDILKVCVYITTVDLVLIAHFNTEL